MKRNRRLSCYGLVAFIAAAARADDAEGCKDAPIFTRFPGSTIEDCSLKTFDEIELPVSLTADKDTASKHLEGRIEKLT